MPKKAMVLVVALSFLFVSCAAHTHVVGSGAHSSAGAGMSQKQFYILSLWPIGNSADTEMMADGASDYTIHTRQTFIDGVINAVTLGIIGARTVTVTK